MVQAKSYSDEEITKMILHGSIEAYYEANIDKENYAKFKLGETDGFSNSVIRDMNLLNLLERLGYPMDELGTYLYKDMIAEIYALLPSESNRKDINRCRALMSELTDAYSQFYHNIARDWKEMGIKSFHLHIQRAIDRINDEIVDKELSKRMFGDNPSDLDYGLQAFQIAAYAQNKYSYDNTQQYKKPLVRKLSNAPDNVVLKDDISLL